jgi:hypothetical protein
MGRPTNYADGSQYSRVKLGDGIAITKADQAYRKSMHLSNVEFLRRLGEAQKGRRLIG